ncbi:MAG: VacJ family lipoprotein [Lentisphaeria bacterium]|nr:VacJ family lipoprotein [Lentisphaeria bacterium]
MMSKTGSIIFAIWLVAVLAASPCSRAQDDDAFDDYLDGEEEMTMVADPLESVNRVFYHFNDKLHAWILNPVAKGYRAVVPEEFRIATRNVFENMRMPKRFVNCLLQGKLKASGTELLRFVVNSTIGVAGIEDVAGDELGIKAQREDTGQTLGGYGIGEGIYITWPILGPSNLRDSVGFVGDMLLDPITWLVPNIYARGGIRTEEVVNGTSLRIGEYEKTQAAALDHYESLKDMYTQYRQEQIKR